MAGNLSRSNELNAGKGIFVKIVTVLGMLFLLAPLIILVFYSFNSSKIVTMWEGFSFRWYQSVIDDRSLWLSIKNSLIIALVNTLAATTLGTMAALALGKYKFKSKKLFVNFLYIPMILPELIFGISLLILFIVIKLPLGLVSIIFAHVTFSIPFVAVEVLSKVGSLDVSLEEASMDLGANRWTTFRKVILPQISAGVISGALFAFTMSIDDFVITFFTAGTGVSTLPLKIYSLIKTGITPAINAISAILIVLTILIIFAINSLHKITELKKGIRRTAGAAAIVCFGLLVFLIFQEDNTEELYISNYAEYLSSDVIRDFEKEYGINVNLDYYNDNEELLAKMQMGALNSDIIVPSDYMVRIMIKENLLSHIDLNNIPNYRFIDSAFKHLNYDPLDSFHVPYTFGYSGMAYNSEVIKDTSFSWKILWDEKYKGKILLTDDMREVFGIGFLVSGSRMEYKDPGALQKALTALVQLKPNIKKFDSNLSNDFLVAGEVYFAQTWNGNFSQLASEHEKFRFAVPDEGAFYFVDNFCIPKSANNKKNAELFINYLLQPEVAAKNMRKVFYSMPNPEASKYMDTKQKKYIHVKIPKETMDRLRISPELGDFMMELEKAWTKLKSN